VYLIREPKGREQLLAMLGRCCDVNLHRRVPIVPTKAALCALRARTCEVLVR
jgi:hypothetical protein